ncbi:hypothetical protein AHF37_09952 [Paragonimus kellicotti]|nr:hypothetical protein AHF37_09952 [Paragonimus kellicotti]
MNTRSEVNRLRQLVSKLEARGTHALEHLLDKSGQLQVAQAKDSVHEWHKKLERVKQAAIQSLQERLALEKQLTSIQIDIDKLQAALRDLEQKRASALTSISDSSLSDDEDAIVDVIRRTKDHIASNVTDASKQLTALQSLADSLHSANQWLSNLQNDYATLSGDQISATTDLSGLTDMWDQQYRELDRLLQCLSATGESHKTNAKQAMEPLVSQVVGRQYDTTALVMVARRELADFQTELGRLQRQLEAELNQVCDVTIILMKLLVQLDALFSI